MSQELTTEEIRRAMDCLKAVGTLQFGRGFLPGPISREPSRVGTVYGWRWWWVRTSERLVPLLPKLDPYAVQGGAKISDMSPIQVRTVSSYRLESIHKDSVLEPGVPLEAICTQKIATIDYPFPQEIHSQKSPFGPCSCGIYAFKSMEEAMAYWTGERVAVVSRFTRAIRPRALMGRLAMWGHIVEHDRGYRAEYAYPAQLLCRESDTEWAGKVGETYGVPVTVFPQELAGLIP